MNREFKTQNYDSMSECHFDDVKYYCNLIIGEYEQDKFSSDIATVTDLCFREYQNIYLANQDYLLFDEFGLSMDLQNIIKENHGKISKKFILEDENGEDRLVGPYLKIIIKIYENKKKIYKQTLEYKSFLDEMAIYREL